MMSVVKGLEISHVKSHLQMYRRMTETTSLNMVITMENYHKEHTNWFPPRQISKGIREGPPNKKMQPLVNQEHSNSTQDEEDSFHNDHEDTKGSSSRDMTKEEFGVCKNERNFWHLEDHLISEFTASSNSLDLPIFHSSTHTHLNLDLTISSSSSS